MGITYKKAGVDIKKADRLIEKIKKMTSKKNKNVLTSIGGFSGLIRLSRKYKNPVIASSCDGVGTKLKIANLLSNHKVVGIDVVAMNVNDLVTSGAEPLFFLDYISTSKLKIKNLEELIKGIKKGCRDAGCILLGGETAQMPQFYKNDDYDVAGFSVGIVDRKDIIDCAKIKAKDVIIGLKSNGLHSNGFSLVRKAFSENYIKKNRNLFYRSTKIYVKPILKLKDKVKIKGIAHITGGGFYDNIKRILPKGISAKIDKKSWPCNKIFKLIQDKAKISDYQMYHTFNMGIGMIVIVNKKDVKKTLKSLSKNKVKSYIIGECIKDKNSKVII